MPVRRHPLYFEAEREDDLRRVGYSKERRVDPQIIVGLLVDRRGFPLQVGCWEGNKAETTTIIPVVEAFQAAHGIEDLIIVADASMLSAANLTALDEARLRFIIGARTTRAPGDLEGALPLERRRPPPMGRSLTPSPPKEARTPSGTRAASPSRCGTRTPIQAHGGPSGSTPRSERPGTTRPSQLRPIAPGPSVAGEKRPKGTRFVTVHQGDQVLDAVGGLEGLHHRDDRGGLSLVALPAADLERKTMTVDQQAHDDLGVDPPLLGVTDLAQVVLTLGLEVQGGDACRHRARPPLAVT